MTSSQNNLPKAYVYDIETYPNFFLAVFKEAKPDGAGEVLTFAWDQIEDLYEFLAREHRTLVGYNNRKFDDKVIRAVLGRHFATERKCFEYANRLINNGWQLPRAKDPRDVPPWTSIDLMQILGGPALAGTLKSHGVRLAMPNVQELPISPGTTLTDSEKETITAYCKNDVATTEALYFDLADKISVRYRVNERYPHFDRAALAYSDSAIAEQVMIHELTVRAGFNSQRYKPARTFEFDPATRIDSAIHFNDKNSQMVLQNLRCTPKFDVTNWSNRLSQRFVFNIGSHKLPLTEGGLHTKVDPRCVRSNGIVEFDVASYYPNLIRRFGRSPEGLPAKWIAIFNQLVDQRLAAKHAGDAATASVYKIVTNSIYGKLKDGYSINYDRNLQLQVVINGQLFLMMLMERFHDAGFEIIAANTDGIYINASGKLNEVLEIAERWQAETGFSLESKTAAIYVANSVNNYALYGTEKGWFHKKGAFAVGKRTKPEVIKNAILNFIKDNKPVSETVNECENIFDFLYSGSVTGHETTVLWGGEKVQRTNRWYKSIGGLPLTAVRTGEDGKERRMTVPYSEHSKIANRITVTTIPADLDRSHYIEEAELQLAKILAGVMTEQVEPPSLIARAIKAQKLGLVIVPKGKMVTGMEKANVPDTFAEKTISYWRSTPLAEADWGDYEGFGAYTGPKFGVVAIDIDDPHAAALCGLYNLIPNSGVVTLHGNGTADDVRKGRKPGTILFSYTGETLRPTNGSFRKDHGFEIIYGNNVIQLAGYHPSQEKYKFVGKLTPLPDLLLEKLEWLIPEQGNACDNISYEMAEIGTSTKLEWVQSYINEDEHYKALGGRVEFRTSKENKLHLTGPCVGGSSHTNKTNSQNMQVGLWNGKVKVSCFHHSCEPIRRAWEKRLQENCIVQKLASVKSENIIVREEHAAVFEALQHPATHKLIIAPPGSGKTYGIVNHIAPMLDADSDDKSKFAIVCSSKDEMTQVAKRFAEVLESENINELGIDLIEADAAISVGNARSIAKCRKSTRVAITHYTYVSRKKASVFYYAFLKFIDSNTHVFIDEVDAFVDSQTFNLSLGSRWKRISSEGISKQLRLQKCGMFHKFGNCINCSMRIYDGYRLSVDQYGGLIYEALNEISDGDVPQQNGHVEFNDLITSKVRVGTMEISMLHQSEDPGALRFDDTGEQFKPDTSTIFHDLFKASYLPTVHRPVIVQNGQEVDRETLVKKYIDMTGHKLKISDEERKQIRFPSKPCNVFTFAVIDRRPLVFMSKAKSLTMLTATLTPLRKRFLAETIGQLRELRVTPLDERRMDRIIVVGMSNSIPVKFIAEGAWQFDRMLRFRETQSAGLRDFDKLKRSTIATKFSMGKVDYIGSDEQSDSHRILLTYSFGSLGRGLDMPHYDLVDINASIYKPISAYVTDDPETVSRLINEDRSNTLTQNIGRILRRPKDSNHPATKVIVIEELDTEEQFNAVVQQISNMSIEPVQSWWVPDYLTAEDICPWLSRISLEKVIPNDVPRGPLDLVGEARKLIERGFSKQELKLELRWATIRKKLAEAERTAIEAEIDEMLAARDPRVRRQKLLSPEKATIIRTKRAAKIHNLVMAGKTDGQIRNNMKVYGPKRAWLESEQQWFEQFLSEARSHPDSIAA